MNNRRTYWSVLRHIALCLTASLVTFFAIADDNVSITEHYADVNGIKLHYLSAGQGETVVILHGFPHYAALWEGTIKRLSQHYRVIVPDNRGYGLSSKPKGVDAYKIAVLANDISSLIKHVNGNEKVHLIGHDWGGTLAWDVAETHPELIEKLVVINAPPLSTFIELVSTDEAQSKASAYMNYLKSGMFEQQHAKEGASLLWGIGFDDLYNKQLLNSHDKAIFFERWQSGETLEAAINWYRANIPDKPVKEFTPFTLSNTPTLLIWGENERVFIPQIPALLDAAIEDYQYVIMPNVGHTPFLENEADTARIIKNFLSF